MLLLVLSYTQTEENVIGNGGGDVTDKFHGSVELENAIERPDGEVGLVVVCNQSERCLPLCNTCDISCSQLWRHQIECLQALKPWIDPNKLSVFKTINTRFFFKILFAQKNQDNTWKLRVVLNQRHLIGPNDIFIAFDKNLPFTSVVARSLDTTRALVVPIQHPIISPTFISHSYRWNFVKSIWIWVYFLCVSIAIPLGLTKPLLMIVFRRDPS